MENGKVMNQLRFMAWMKEKYPLYTLKEQEAIYVGIYFQNRLKAADFMKQNLSWTEDRKEYIRGMMNEYLKHYEIPVIMTDREIFAEELSGLRKINPARHCSECNDSLFTGIKLLPDGSKLLMKCGCATYGETEYNRLFDSMINLEKNLTEIMLSMRKGLGTDIQSSWNATYANFKAIYANFVTVGNALDEVKKNTFWGGIRYRFWNVFHAIVRGGLRFVKAEEKKEEKK